MAFTKRIFFIALLTTFFACKKDANVDTPTVQITAPSGLQTFNVFDTVTIKAHVTDPQGLKSISVFLATGQSVQVLPTASVSITSNDMQISVPYVLNDIHLLTGPYYITIQASNGTNTGVAYQQINVNAVPEKRTAIFAITRNGHNSNLSQLDSQLHVTGAYPVTGDFSASDISSYYQQLYIAGYDSGNVNAFNVPSVSQAWSLPGTISITPSFTNVYSYGDAAYVSFYGPITGTGYVNYYNHAGTLQANIPVSTNFYPIKTFLWSGFIFVEQKAKSSNADNLVLYFPSSGFGYEQDTLSGPVAGMFGVDNNNIMVFGNRTSGAPYTYIYTIPTNAEYSPFSLPNAKILSVVQLNNEQFFVAFNNGNIYQYTYNPLNQIQYITGVNAAAMRYDFVNNQLIVANGKVVQEYNCGPSSGTLVATTTPFADSVKDVQVLYNH